MKKIILISGCSSGLGKYAAEMFESSGYKVYAGMRAKNLTQLTKIWRQQKRNISAVKLDITDDRECQMAVEQIIKKEGRIDVLINNAGYTLVGQACEFTSKQFMEILNTNTVGAFRLMKNVLPHMMQKKSGRIINITSLNGILALPNFAMYCASKFALEGFALALRYEVASKNIWVTNLAPGAIQSPGLNSTRDMPHKPAREKFLLLKILMPLTTYKKITDKLEWIIASPRPPAEVILGADAYITTSLQRFLPKRIWDYLLFYVWNK